MALTIKQHLYGMEHYLPQDIAKYISLNYGEIEDQGLITDALRILLSAHMRKYKPQGAVEYNG